MPSSSAGPRYLPEGMLRVFAGDSDWSASPLGPPSLWPAELLQCFALCMDSLAAMAVCWGPELCLLYGPAYAPLLAEKHPAALGQSARYAWADIWDVIEPQLKAVLASGVGFATSSQQLGLLQQGATQQKYFSYSFAPIRSADGQVVGVLSIATETTAQVLADRERLATKSALDQQTAVSVQSRDLLQALTSGTPDVIYAKDLQGRLVHANDTVCRMFGRELADILGHDDSHFLPASQAAALMANDRAVMASRQTHAVEEQVQIVGPSGPLTRTYLSTKSPWIAADGSLLGIFGISRDITERKRHEQALHELNDTLEVKVAERTRERDRIWRVSRDIFVVAHPDGMFAAVNPAFERILGWSVEHATSRPFLEMVQPEDRGSTLQEFEKLLSGATTSGFECRFLHRDGGYRWLNWTAVPEDDLVYAVGRDVTDEHLQTETLAHAEDQLRQAQKMEAVGQLTGGIAHDFNNLLATIMTNLELLQRRSDTGRLEDLPRYIAMARGSAQRAAALTHRLLAFSRRQSLDPQAVDVNALVAGMEDLMRRTLGINIELTTVLDPDLPFAFTDANQLESALLNLAINARDAMPVGGRLTIQTRLTELDEHAGTKLEAGHYLLLSVSDNGMGMTPEVRGKAFEPFFTTKPIGQGTGLGLSMIYGYARQSGGHVAIDSKAGAGTTVRLYLPQHVHPASLVLPEPVNTATPHGAGESVLVVEDEPGVRMVVLEVLTELGYRAYEAVDAASALRVIESGVHIDLLVTDVGLPGINGRQLAEMARLQRPGLKVLFVTGYAGQAVVYGEFLAPGMEMLGKPFTIDELARRIEDMLHGRAARPTPSSA